MCFVLWCRSLLCGDARYVSRSRCGTPRIAPRITPPNCTAQ